MLKAVVSSIPQYLVLALARLHRLMAFSSVDSAILNPPIALYCDDENLCFAEVNIIWRRMRVCSNIPSSELEALFVGLWARKRGHPVDYQEKTQAPTKCILL
jgi:hypothetical protein